MCQGRTKCATGCVITFKRKLNWPASRVALGGTCLLIDRLQFSILAESELYYSWKYNAIGITRMTSMPEAKLTLEAALCYSMVAMVTDYSCLHLNHDDAPVDAIIKVLLANADNTRGLVN
jgi:5'-methylthioadenosine phosphorylase